MSKKLNLKKGKCFQYTHHDTEYVCFHRLICSYLAALESNKNLSISPVIWNNISITWKTNIGIYLIHFVEISTIIFDKKMTIYKYFCCTHNIYYINTFYTKNEIMINQTGIYVGDFSPYFNGSTITLKVKYEKFKSNSAKPQFHFCEKIKIKNIMILPKKKLRIKTNSGFIHNDDDKRVYHTI